MNAVQLQRIDENLQRLRLFDESGQCARALEQRTLWALSAHWSRGVRPSSPRWGDWWYSASTQAHRVRFSVSRLVVASGVRWRSQAARRVRKNRSIFPFPAG